MAPLVASLISSGMNLLGNAVLAKGKDVIEEKLGVDLDKAVQSEEGLFKLKQLELDHEEFLVTSSIDEAKVYLQDVQGARTLGIELAKSTSWLNQNIMPVLALLTVSGSTWLLWFGNSADVKMAATSFITMVLGYFFGSSKGSKDKQEQLYRVSQP